MLLTISRSSSIVLILTLFSSVINVHETEASNANNYAPFDDTISYKINWAGKKLNDQELNGDENEKNKEGLVAKNNNNNNNAKLIVQDSNSLYITTKDKEKYHCILPKVDQFDSNSDSSGNLGSELSPYQLLRPLFAREVCSYRLEQYWTYEICHGRFIRQFHEDSSVKKSQTVATQEYILGKYELSNLATSEAAFDEKLAQYARDGRKRPTLTLEEMQLPYIEINMTGGTLCDLRNIPRQTKVFYVCNEDAKHELYSIKETSTCEYEAIVLSPLLCLHPEFKVKQIPEDEITCYSMGKAQSKPKGLRRLESEAKKQRMEQQKKTKDTGFPGNLFSGKTIIIGASEFGKELRINIISENQNDDEDSLDSGKVFDSKILKSFLSGDLCLHGGTGWWRYEFCYGDKVEQYHEVKGSKTVKITLGKWNKGEHEKWLDLNPSRKPKAGKTPKQVSHFYSNGDLCDVTGKPRQVEVKLKCRHIEGHPDSVALYLLEPKTCEYILGIESPIICHLLSTVDEYGMMHHPDGRTAEEVLTTPEV